MAAKHDQTHRQWRREDETNWSPQPCPKGRGYNDRHWRKSAAVSVDHRLDHVTDQRFDDKEKGRRHQHHGPAGVNGGRNDQRKDRSDNCANIRHKAQNHRQ